MKSQLLRTLPRHAILAAGTLCAVAFSPVHADDAAALTKMRDALKSTMLQLRSVTTDRDNLQAQATDLQSQVDTLTKQSADAIKKASDDKVASDKTIAVLKSQVDSQAGSISTLQTTLAKWEKSQKDTATIAIATEAKRAKLADIAIHLQRIVDDQKVKNQAMYKLGMEVLDRYEKFGIGEALTAKEPFTGLTRTKFETLVQDYEDKLVDQTITSNSNPPSQHTTSPSQSTQKTN